MTDILASGYLRECLSLDKTSPTGLRWNLRPASHFVASGKRSAKHIASLFNAKHSGEPAGSLHTATGYRCVKLTIDGRPRAFKVHRIIWALHYGAWPTEAIDHIDGDRQNNQISNLRDVSSAVNGRNQKTHNTNTSGFPGVSLHRQNRKWTAHITANGKRHYLGSHPTPEGAHAARLAFVATHPELGYTARHTNP